MGIKKLQRKKAWEEVSDQIKSLIIAGDWQPGDRLPAETELAGKFGISRPTLREALRQLNLLGLIDIRHGEGNFVSHPKAESFMLPLLPLLITNKDNVLSIMEARMMIEVTTAALAADRVSAAEIESLAGYLEQMIAACSNKEVFAKTDHLFHKLIALATRNEIIIKMYQAIEDLLLGQQLRIIGLPDAIQSGINEHQKIYHAIQNHDAKAAQTAMCNHMENTQARILSNLNKAPLN